MERYEESARSEWFHCRNILKFKTKPLEGKHSLNAIMHRKKLFGFQYCCQRELTANHSELLKSIASDVFSKGLSPKKIRRFLVEFLQAKLMTQLSKLSFFL